MTSALSFSLVWLALMLSFFKNQAFKIKFFFSVFILILSNIPIIYHLSLNQWALSFISPLSTFSTLIIFAYVGFFFNLFKKAPLDNFYSNLIIACFSLLLLSDILGFLSFSIYHHFYISVGFAGIFCAFLFLSNSLLGFLALLALLSYIFSTNLQLLDTLFDAPLFLISCLNLLYCYKKRL
ncbi:hypothetical protein [Helicobacter cetorum]|uniref:hypothetical protein n=1 Tax=Helicobacter cetorum TaxID=138563 RepID=UPI000CF16BD8|nr:hypothetical protein [Helicobacter cetorum]